MHLNKPPATNKAERAAWRQYLVSVPRPIVPREPGFINRIPALTNYHEGQLLLVYDRRPIPQPKSNDGWQAVGGAMVEDLPNPNRLYYTTSRNFTKWAKPQPVPGTPEICADAALAWDGQSLTMVYVSSDQVGYFGSSRFGPKLDFWIATGPDITQLKHRKYNNVYGWLGVDGIFCTSGSVPVLTQPPKAGSSILAGCAVFPLVVRKRTATGDQAQVVLMYLRHGALIAFSGPLQCAYPLDEAAVAVVDGTIHVNARIQGRGGRIHFVSEDGLNFVQSADFAQLNPDLADTSQVPDPGCNACLIVVAEQLALIHPHTAGGLEDRHHGAMIGADGRVLATFGTGGFGYSDCAELKDGSRALVFERNQTIFLTVQRT